MDTRDLNDHVLVEFDENEELVSMMMEHAIQQMDVASFSDQAVTQDRKAA